MTTRQLIERYGLALAVIIALVITVAVVPGNTKPGSLAAGGSSGTGGSYAAGSTSGGSAVGGSSQGGSSGSAVSGPGEAGSGTGVGAVASGGVASGGPGAGGEVGGGGSTGPDVIVGSGPHCRADGREVGYFYAMPPCVWWRGTNNGGATAPGVTANKIVVVRYIPQIDPGTRAILQGTKLSDDPSVVARAYQAVLRYANMHWETYGREVVFQDFHASGSPTNDEASRADAIQIASVIKPFAVIEGDPAQTVPIPFDKEIARRNVLCLCSVSLPSDTYQSLPPLLFSPLPTLDEYTSTTGEYICKKLAGKAAQFAGPGTQGKPRKFGMIYITGQNEVVYPEYLEFKTRAEEAFARCGLRFDKEIGYSYDPGRNQADVTNLIAQLKAAGITTVVPFWDPLYPILITTEATRQVYFPEWFMTGTGLSDTTTAGRLYDQQQWKHAFGISPLWVTWLTVAKSIGYLEYHWARPQDPPGSEGVLINVYYARVNELFTLLQGAGPNLNNTTIATSAFNYPHTGGSPARPLLFRTRAFPTAIKDFSEVWYDASAQGPDERGEQGSGEVTRADGGKRYQLGQWPLTPSLAFVTTNTATVSDNPVGGGNYPTDVPPNAYPASQRCLSCT